MHVLIVEEDPVALASITQLVRGAFDVRTSPFQNSAAALGAAAQTAFDLALVSHDRSGLDAVDFIRGLTAQQARHDVPMVLVVADEERGFRRRAIDAGATDFVKKPLDPDELRVRLRNLLRLREAGRKLADGAKELSGEVETATSSILRREEEIIWRLARAIEHRDGGTGDHVSRVAAISFILAEEIGLDRQTCHTIRLAAPLHDVGKLGITDAILHKPGPLDEAEAAAMRRHVEIGGDILANGESGLVRMAERIALTHHERWDGGGYPRGLSGDAIPIEGRIVALADVLDALAAPRPYKPAWSVRDAISEVDAQSGRHFDPACVAALHRAWPRIEAALAPVPHDVGRNGPE